MFAFRLTCIPSAFLLFASGCGPSLTALVREGDLIGVSKKITEGVDVNKMDRYHNVPLVAAAYRGHDEIAAVLLQAGADPNAPNGSGFTPLGAAVFAGSPSMVEALLEAGAQPNNKTHNGLYNAHANAYFTPLACAVDQLSEGAGCDEYRCVPPENYLYIIGVLLAAGADPNQGEFVGDNGGLASTQETPIQSATACSSASGKQTEIDTSDSCRKALDLLVAGGADINLRDSQGSSALLESFHLRDDDITAENFSDTITYLIENGALFDSEQIRALPRLISLALLQSLEEGQGLRLRNIRVAQLQLAVHFGADIVDTAWRDPRLSVGEGEVSALLGSIALAAQGTAHALGTASALLELGVDDDVDAAGLHYELVSTRNSDLLTPEEWETALRAGRYPARDILARIAQRYQLEAEEEAARQMAKIGYIAAVVMVVGVTLAAADLESAPTDTKSKSKSKSKSKLSDAAPATWLIEGEVMREDGQPCADCRVTAVSSYLGITSWSATGQPDADGHFSLTAAAHDTCVEVLYVDGDIAWRSGRDGNSWCVGSPPSIVMKP